LGALWILAEFFFSKNEETDYKFYLHTLVFEHKDNNGVYIHTAVCIQLNLDVCGNSIDEVKKELINTVRFYFYVLAQACTMKSVRDQIEGVCTVCLGSSMPASWNRYPCRIEKQCEAKGALSCSGLVGIIWQQAKFFVACS